MILTLRFSGLVTGINRNPVHSRIRIDPIRTEAGLGPGDLLVISGRRPTPLSVSLRKIPYVTNYLIFLLISRILHSLGHPRQFVSFQSLPSVPQAHLHSDIFPIFR